MEHNTADKRTLKVYSSHSNAMPLATDSDNPVLQSGKMLSSPTGNKTCVRAAVSALDPQVERHLHSIDLVLMQNKYVYIYCSCCIVTKCLSF